VCGLQSLQIRQSGSGVEKFRTGIEQQQIVAGIYNIQRRPGVTAEDRRQVIGSLFSLFFSFLSSFFLV